MDYPVGKRLALVRSSELQALETAKNVSRKVEMIVKNGLEGLMPVVT
jgi:hypothetical protein